MSMDGRHNRKNKALFSNSSGVIYVDEALRSQTYGRPWPPLLVRGASLFSPILYFLKDLAQFVVPDLTERKACRQQAARPTQLYK